VRGCILSGIGPPPLLPSLPSFPPANHHPRKKAKARQWKPPTYSAGGCACGWLACTHFVAQCHQQQPAHPSGQGTGACPAGKAPKCMGKTTFSTCPPLPSLFLSPPSSPTSHLAPACSSHRAQRESVDGLPLRKPNPQREPLTTPRPLAWPAISCLILRVFLRPVGSSPPSLDATTITTTAYPPPGQASTQ
jgi:hypothetical protein